jgi:GT2 family glycosyltransferase
LRQINFMELSIIVLSYNTKDLLKKSLYSIYNNSSGLEFEVIVSDNGSKDQSIEMVRTEFPQARIIENGENLGFSQGNNVAIKQALGMHVLLLNSDAEVTRDALKSSVEYLNDNPDVGALGGKVLLPNGLLDKACRRKFPNPWNSFMRLFGFGKFSDYNVSAPVDEQAEVDAVMGAYMMVPRKVIDEVGMLDEAFFMYGEDLDWCLRIKQAGYKVLYFPKAEVIHHKYGSSKNIPFKMIKLAHKAMWIFYRKHYSSKYPFLFNWFVRLGIFIRMYLVLGINLFRSKKTVH